MTDYPKECLVFETKNGDHVEALDFGPGYIHVRYIACVALTIDEEIEQLIPLTAAAKDLEKQCKVASKCNMWGWNIDWSNYGSNW